MQTSVMGYFDYDACYLYILNGQVRDEEDLRIGAVTQFRSIVVKTSKNHFNFLFVYIIFNGQIKFEFSTQFRIFRN